MKNRIKKEYYITELYMGDDGLEDTTDISGPHTLIKARRIMEKIMKNPGNMINPYSFSIRGPHRSINSICGSHQYKSQWYANSDTQTTQAK